MLVNVVVIASSSARTSTFDVGSANYVAHANATASYTTLANLPPIHRQTDKHHHTQHRTPSLCRHKESDIVRSARTGPHALYDLY